MMTRRSWWMVLVAGMVLCSASVRAAEETPRPNIVFFLIDDLASADCGFNGGTEIQTPNIDRLAQDGSILEALYVQPVCSPTRAALMTGRYATRTGVYTVVRPHAKWGLPLGERTLAEALRETGYETAIVGKWHLGEFEAAYRPMSRGFDHQYGHYFGAIDHFEHTRDGTHDWYRDEKESREEGYSTELLTREACRVITDRDAQRPLFLYVPFNAVHAPLQAPDKYTAPYTHLTGPRRKLAGMLAAVDAGIGKIVETLQRQGIREQTLIVFSADNGGPKPGSNGKLRNFKGSVYEGGIRASSFVNWPGKIPAGRRITEPMHTVDWFPTLVGLAQGTTAAAKLDASHPIDGKNVWPMLARGEKSPHDAILIPRSPTTGALRMGDWKLIVSGGAAAEADEEAAEKTSAEEPKAKRKKKRARDAAATSPAELYNLASDPGETTNLADKEPQKLAELRTKFDELMRGAVRSGQKQ